MSMTTECRIDQLGCVLHGFRDPKCKFFNYEHEPPALRAGERDEWEYRETMYGAEARARQFAIRLHWTGLADIGDTRATVRQIVTEHNQHATLVEQRDRLFMAAKFLLAMNTTNYDRDAMRSEGGFDALQKAVDYAIEQSGNSAATIERDGV